MSYEYWDRERVSQYISVEFWDIDSKGTNWLEKIYLFGLANLFGDFLQLCLGIFILRFLRIRLRH